MLKTLILILAHTIVSNISLTENIVFSVIQENKQVGEMVGQKSISSDNVIYSCLTNVTTKKIIKIKVLSEYQVTMQEGKLQMANANIKVKGLQYANHYTEFCKEDCDKSNRKSSFTNQTIHFTCTMLLFEEPINVSRIYNELDGKFHILKSKGSHIYEKINPEGKVSRYFYKNGKLEKAVIETDAMNFSLVRKI